MHTDTQSCLDHLFRLSADMLCQAEVDGRFLHVNPSWSEALGWSSEELLSMRWLDLVHPDDVEAAQSVCSRTSIADRASQRLIRCRRQDGTYAWTSWKADIQDEDRMCAVVREVGERNATGENQATGSAIELLLKLEEEQKTALKELEILVYTVSHDVRAPIRQIIQYSDMATDALSSGGAEEAAYFVARIAKISRRTSQLLVDLLWFSQASNAPLEKDYCNLSRLALEILAEISGRHPERRIEIDVDDDMRVRGDWRLLRILFTNIIGNACKFTADQEVGLIRVEAKECEGRTVFSVRDNGVGFDPACAKELFEPFVRAHSSERFGGTGIGLATARRIVERHGGMIWAESRGDGAVFSFTLGEDSNNSE